MLNVPACGPIPLNEGGISLNRGWVSLHKKSNQRRVGYDADLGGEGPASGFDAFCKFWSFIANFSVEEKQLGGNEKGRQGRDKMQQLSCVHTPPLVGVMNNPLNWTARTPNESSSIGLTGAFTWQCVISSLARKYQHSRYPQTRYLWSATRLCGWIWWKIGWTPCLFQPGLSATPGQLCWLPKRCQLGWVDHCPVIELWHTMNLHVRQVHASNSVVDEKI